MESTLARRCAAHLLRAHSQAGATCSAWASRACALVPLGRHCRRCRGAPAPGVEDGSAAGKACPPQAKRARFARSRAARGSFFDSTTFSPTSLPCLPHLQAEEAARQQAAVSLKQLSSEYEAAKVRLLPQRAAARKASLPASSGVGSCRGALAALAALAGEALQRAHMPRHAALPAACKARRRLAPPAAPPTCRHACRRSRQPSPRRPLPASPLPPPRTAPPLRPRPRLRSRHPPPLPRRRPRRPLPWSLLPQRRPRPPRPTSRCLGLRAMSRPCPLRPPSPSAAASRRRPSSPPPPGPRSDHPAGRPGGELTGCSGLPAPFMVVSCTI